jgi:hypothetical protein
MVYKYFRRDTEKIVEALMDPPWFPPAFGHMGI